MCHIVGIEPQFKNILLNGPYVPMKTGQRKPEGQWTRAESKAANLYQRLKILCPDDEKDTRSSQEYLNDLEEEYQERALLAKFKRFFKRGLKGLVVQRKLMKSYATNVKHKLRLTKEFEAKYNKVKAKLALIRSSVLASKSSMVKNKGLVTEAYEWNEEDVSSYDNEIVEVKVLMELADDENTVVGKESAKNGEWVKILMKRVLKDLGYLKPKYDSTDESSVCSTPLPLLEKLVGAEPIFGPKTIKSILKSNSTFKVETLKGVTINKPTSPPAKGNKNVLGSEKNLALASKLKNMKTEDGFLYLL
nr:hypothetical protein [Tanacetum cinerariifolium]